MAICLGTWARRELGLKVCYAAPGDDKGGGAAVVDDPDDDGKGGEGSDDDDDPVYTEAEFKRKMEESMKRHRRNLQRELKKKEKDAESFQSQMQELQTRLEETEAQLAKKVEDDPELKGQLEVQQRRYEREMSEIKKTLEEEKQARIAAQEKAKQTQRDIKFKSSLVKAGTIDVEAAFKIMIDSVVFDDVDEDWRFKTPEGNILSLDEGAAEFLPEYLKPAAARQGGSGTRTGSPRQRQLVSELENEKKKLEAMRAEVIRNPTNNMALSQYGLQKKKVQELALKVETTK